MFRLRALTPRVLTVLTLTVTAAACTRGCAGKDEVAFCEAVERKDHAAAQTLLDSGRVNILARNTSGKCQPIMQLFGAATPRSPEFTAMAVAVVKRDGIANTCWTTPSTSSRGLSRSGGGGGTECPILAATMNGNAALVRALIDGGVDVKDHVARQAMGNAIAQGTLDVVQMLVNAGADADSALTAAIRYPSPPIVAYLEGHGAHEQGVDPLLVAARQGNVAAIDAAIAAGSSLEAEDLDQRTPLLRAVMYRKPEAVTRLAKAGANVNHTVEGHTALHHAANANDVAVVRALAAAGANLNARADGNSPTPIQAAIENGAHLAVRALIDAGADANVAIDSETTAIVRAIELGNLSMVRDLLRGGARINDKRGTRWQPPIQASLGLCGYAPEGRDDRENDHYRVALLRTIVSAGASASAANAEGLTPVAVVKKRLAEADHPFYRECYQAKLDYLGSLH